MLNLPRVAQEFIMRPELSLEKIAQEAAKVKVDVESFQREAQLERKKLANEERAKTIEKEVEDEMGKNVEDRRWRDWQLDEQMQR